MPEHTQAFYTIPASRATWGTALHYQQWLNDRNPQDLQEEDYSDIDGFTIDEAYAALESRKKRLNY